MIHFDFETRSELDVKDVGAYVYAKHPSTEAMCLAYRIDEGDIKLWRKGDPKPHEIIRHVELGTLFVAHNIEFDANIWEHTLGWPRIPLWQRRDTAAMVAAMSLPRSLEKAVEALKLPVKKDMEGSKLMKKMAKPRRPSKLNPAKYWELPEQIERLHEYCKQDVVTESMLAKKVRPLSDMEEKVFQTTNAYNERGVFVDVPTCKTVVDMLAQGRERAFARMPKYGLPEDALSRVALLTKWVQEQGVDTDNLRKQTVSDLLRTDLPQHVREVLELRQDVGKTSTAKYDSLINRTDNDGRLRGSLMYHGASTGRWSGRGAQPQNLPRGSVKDTDGAIEALKTGDLEWAEMLYNKSIFEIASSCLRGMFTASPGNKLAICDYSAIEARVLAWLAGQEDTLEVFRGHGKMYEHAAAGIYNKKMEDITKDERFIGKVASLALGYQGAAGAFINMANTYGVQVEEKRAKSIVDGWRDNNKNVVKYWHGVAEHARKAIRQEGTVISYRHLKFQYKNRYLRLALPSGRVLIYPGAFLQGNKIKFRDSMYGITDTYGGKLVENVTQAVARDLLAHAWVKCEEENLPVVISVHDELVIDVPEDFDGLPVLKQIMIDLPDWAAGLPIGAEGFESFRYRKD